MADKKVERFVSPEEDRPVHPNPQPHSLRPANNKNSFPPSASEDTKSELLAKFKAREERIHREHDVDEARTEATPEVDSRPEGSME